MRWTERRRTNCYIDIRVTVSTTASLASTMKFTTSLFTATLMAQPTLVAASLRGNGWDGAAADEHRALKSSSKGSGTGSKSGKADLIAYIGPYPGSDSSASGTVKISFNKDGDMTIKMDVEGVTANCSDGVGGKNQCGIHIHEGVTCNNLDFVGGHFWSPAFSATDPWVPVRYDSNSAGESSYETIVDNGGNGYGADINHGHAFVIHTDSIPGARIGCGLLEYA